MKNNSTILSKMKAHREKLISEKNEYIKRQSNAIVALIAIGVVSFTFLYFGVGRFLIIGLLASIWPIYEIFRMSRHIATTEEDLQLLDKRIYGHHQDDDDDV